MAGNPNKQGARGQGSFGSQSNKSGASNARGEWRNANVNSIGGQAGAGGQMGFQLEEVEGDLFDCPDTDSMAHCVSEDLHMGKGIALRFKNQFKGTGDLWEQYVYVGDVGVLERGGRYIYYLVTKKEFHHKPTYDSLRSSLQAMKTHCLQHRVENLSMPTIGCGLDKLDWYDVSKMIKEVFEDTNVHIKVYVYKPPGKHGKPKPQETPADQPKINEFMKRKADPITQQESSSQKPKKQQNSAGPGEPQQNPTPELRTQQQNSAGPGEPQQNSKGPGTPQQNSEGPGTPQQNSERPGTPQQNSAGPGTPQQNSEGPGKPQQNPTPEPHTQQQNAEGPDKQQQNLTPEPRTAQPNPTEKSAKPTPSPTKGPVENLLSPAKSNSPKKNHNKEPAKQKQTPIKSLAKLEEDEGFYNPMMGSQSSPVTTSPQESEKGGKSPQSKSKKKGKNRK